MADKKEQLRMSLYNFIQENPGISSSQIAIKLAVSRITIYNYLKELINDGLAYSTGQRKSTRYYVIDFDTAIDNAKHEKLRALEDLEDSLREYIISKTLKEHDEVIQNDVIDNLFDNYFMFIDSNDLFHIGIKGFYYWAKSKNFDERSLMRAYEYFELVGSFEYRRKKNGLFDGTESMIANLTNFTEVAIDRLYFQNLFALPNGFGRTRVALELAYGKSNGNPVFLSHAISTALDSIRNYISSNKIDGILFIPPTQSREIQFRDILRKELRVNIKQIHAEKIRDPRRIRQAQKFIKGKEEKIKNAQISMEIKKFNKDDFSHILLLDDSFTTGATPNSLALKLRAEGFTGKISVITICGSFNYDLAITEDEI